MKITAFLDSESQEPVALDEDLMNDAELVGDGSTLVEFLQDATNTSVSEIHVVSENVATIALHALHGILKATDPTHPDGDALQDRDDARAWALAALQELAFYDRDGIEVAYADPSHGDQLGLSMAKDPGREVAGKLFAGQTYEGAKPFVDWPDA